MSKKIYTEHIVPGTCHAMRNVPLYGGEASFALNVPTENDIPALRQAFNDWLSSCASLSAIRGGARKANFPCEISEELAALFLGGGRKISSDSLKAETGRSISTKKPVVESKTFVD